MLILIGLTLPELREKAAASRAVPIVLTVDTATRDSTTAESSTSNRMVKPPAMPPRSPLGRAPPRARVTVQRRPSIFAAPPTFVKPPPRPPSKSRRASLAEHFKAQLEQPTSSAILAATEARLVVAESTVEQLRASLAEAEEHIVEGADELDVAELTLQKLRASIDDERIDAATKATAAQRRIDELTATLAGVSAELSVERSARTAAEGQLAAIRSHLMPS